MRWRLFFAHHLPRVNYNEAEKSIFTFNIEKKNFKHLYFDFELLLKCRKKPFSTSKNHDHWQATVMSDRDSYRRLLIAQQYSEST